MWSVDTDALICDFAETYHIYDMESLPIDLVATLACGLRDNSRIKMKLGGTELTPETFLSATLIDRVTDIGVGLGVYEKAESIVDLLQKEPVVQTYQTPEDFDAARRRIMGGR